MMDMDLGNVTLFLYDVIVIQLTQWPLEITCMKKKAREGKKKQVKEK